MAAYLAGTQTSVSRGSQTQTYLERRVSIEALKHFDVFKRIRICKKNWMFFIVIWLYLNRVGSHKNSHLGHKKLLIMSSSQLMGAESSSTWTQPPGRSAPLSLHCSCSSPVWRRDSGLCCSWQGERSVHLHPLRHPPPHSPEWHSPSPQSSPHWTNKLFF